VARPLDGCPAAEDALLCVSELASNAIQHSRSGLGGRFQVIVWRSRASACLAVLDDGGYGHPAPPPAPGSAGLADLAESGHGIRWSSTWRTAGATSSTGTAQPAAAPSGAT